MNVVAASPRLSPEEYLKLPDHDRFELVGGKLVALPASVRSSRVATRIASLLDHHANAHRLGMVWGADALYRCFADPNIFRKPDASFIARERLVDVPFDEESISIVPDLIVEVLSPGDLAYEIDRKIQDFLGAGVRLAWRINPKMKTALIYRADGTVRHVVAEDELDGEDVIPGFRCRLGDLIPAEPAPSVR